MTPESRARQMAEYLPLLLRDGAQLNRLLEMLGEELSLMEDGVSRLLHSRWLAMARGFSRPEEPLELKAGSELGQLALLFGLSPGSQEDTEYFRTHLASLVAVHKAGLNTAPAILQLVSLVYRAEQPPRVEWRGPTAIGRFTLPSRQEALKVELAENPLLPGGARFRGIAQGQRLLTVNGGLDSVIPELSMTAGAQDVWVPVFTHEQSGLDVIYLGKVPARGTLRLRHQQIPLLNELPSDLPVLVANTTRFATEGAAGADSRFNARRARFSAANAMDLSLPTLQPGENHWIVGTLSQRELDSYLKGLAGVNTQGLVGMPAQQQGLAMDLEFQWLERAPATVSLRIPADYLPPRFLQPDETGQAPGMAGLIRELSAALEYGRAAGVRARIEFWMFLKTEQVQVTDASRMELSFSFPERFVPKDVLSSVGPSLEFQDALPTPRERFLVSGYFGATPFGGATFQ